MRALLPHETRAGIESSSRLLLGREGPDLEHDLLALLVPHHQPLSLVDALLVRGGEQDADLPALLQRKASPCWRGVRDVDQPITGKEQLQFEQPRLLRRSVPEDAGPSGDGAQEALGLNP